MRSVVASVVVGLVMGIASARADVPRPANTGSGDAAAKIHLVGGAGVRIKATVGTPFSPRVTMPLFKTDTVVVPPGEFVIVHLVGNNHLVRIDDDVSLKVSEIVVLNAPKTSESLSTQLDRMVSTDEKRAAERIAGTYAGRSAGESAPPQSELRSGTGGGGAPGGSGSGRGSISVSAKSSAKGGTANTADRGPVAAAAPSPAPPPAPRRAASESAAAPATAAAPAPAVAAAPAPAAQPAPPPPPPSPSHVAREESSAKADKPASRAPAKTAPSTNDNELRQPFPSKELRTCLDRELAYLKLPRGGIKVRLRLEGGKIGRIALAGGLPTPDCARQLLLDRPYAGADQTWQIVDLRAN